MKIEVCKGQAGLALYVDDTRVAGVRDNGLMETILSATITDLEAEARALDVLDEAHQITQQGLWQDITELRASCASLRETKDTFFRNAEAWEAKYNAAEQEHQDFRLQNDREWRAKLDHLKAQITAKDAALRECIERIEQLGEKYPDPRRLVEAMWREIAALAAPTRETE
jgi:chromosome segregation ATPase